MNTNTENQIPCRQTVLQILSVVLQEVHRVRQAPQLNCILDRVITILEPLSLAVPFAAICVQELRAYRVISDQTDTKELTKTLYLARLLLQLADYIIASLAEPQSPDYQIMLNMLRDANTEI